MEGVELKPPAVQTIGLTRRYEGKVAVDHIDLSVAEGEFFGFLGPNGAGKSTTINMLVGLLRPTAGQALIQGIDVWEQPLQAKQHIGVLPDVLPPWPGLLLPVFGIFTAWIAGMNALGVEETGCRS